MDSASQTFKSRDAASYDHVTEQFDSFTERLSLPLAVRLISLANLKPHEQVLDVGTGTGVVALQAAPQIATGGKMHGVDLSEGMLAFAKAKAERAGLSDCVEFSQMDAEALKFADASFDVVLSLFALLHFPNPASALKEMYRVLRPGGRLVLAVGSRPPQFSLDYLIQGMKHLNEIKLRRQGKLLKAPQFLDTLARSRLPEAVEPEESELASRSLNRTEGVASLIRQAEFTDVKTLWHGHQAAFDTPEEFWDVQRTFSSIARKRLSAASTEEVEALRKDFLKACRDVQSRKGKLVYPFAAFYVTARRPLS